MSFLRWALFCVSAILLFGIGSGILANSGYANKWFTAMMLPSMTPPGWVFGTVWTILYILLGLSIAMIITARGAPGRGVAIMFFLVQLVLNFGWSPLFFGAHEVTLAFYLLLVILTIATICAFLFVRIRPLAGLLLLPYLVWLCFASYLNYEIDVTNPDAETLVPPAISTQI